MGFGPERFCPPQATLIVSQKLTAEPIFQHCFLFFCFSCKQLLPYDLFIITRQWMAERSFFFFVPRSNDLEKKRAQIKGPVGG